VRGVVRPELLNAETVALFGFYQKYCPFYSNFRKNECFQQGKKCMSLKNGLHLEALGSQTQVSLYFPKVSW